LGCGENRCAVHEAPSELPPPPLLPYRRLFVLLAQLVYYGAAHFERVFLLTTIQHSTPTNRRKSSAAEKGGSEAFKDYGNPARTHAEEGRAERSGQAERSGEGGPGISPQQRHSTMRPRAEERQVQRPGRTQRRRGFRKSPPTTTTQLARTLKKAKPSAAARPSAAEKRGSGVSPVYDTTQHAHAQEKAKRSGEAERSAVRGFDNSYSNLY
jgi:hypothetical protein